MSAPVQHGEHQQLPAAIEIVLVCMLLVVCWSVDRLCRVRPGIDEVHHG